MSTEALLAILALLCAVYPLLPEERRRDIQIRLLSFDWFLILGTVVALHVIKFYPLLLQNGLAPHTGPWRFGLDAESASYLLVMCVCLVLALRIWRRPLAASRLPEFHALVETQLQQRHFGNLAALLGRHWDRLVQLHRPDGTWRARRFQQFDARPGVRIVIEGQAAIRTGRPEARGLPAVRRWMARRFAGAERAQDRVYEILHIVLPNEEFVAYLASTHLSLALRILSYPTHDRDVFQSHLFEALMSDTRSAFYRELRDNTNLRGGNRYALPPRNRLLCHYFTNPNVAYDLAVYRPVGEFAIQWLSRRGRQGETDSYDLALDEHFQEVEVGRCPVHATIQFFDIMVLEALHHRVPWHMWLYYFPTFTDRILANMTSRADVNYEREWPTPYHLLLYRLFSAIRSWVEEAALLSERDPAVSHVAVNLAHDNASIPKSAVIALGQCLRRLLLAPQVTPRFKTYIVESLLHDLQRMMGNPHATSLTHAMAATIARGGERGFGEPSATGYRDRLITALEDVDMHLCFELAQRQVLPELGPLIAEALGWDSGALAGTE
ncbi:hypothetical protein [Gemmatimonas sp.]|uniref:hypothetical protein n=1 Tax=Gemmatimonas sp. TaxID=1962908 RepID=UPI003F6FAD32